MLLPDHILFWLDQQGKMVAAEIPASQSDHRAWIGVYPWTEKKPFYKIRYFEVSRHVLEQGYDIAEPDLLNSQRLTAHSSDELAAILMRWLTDLNVLVQPYFCDYPI